MRTMWKKAIRILCVGGLLSLCLAGCGKDVGNSPKLPTQETPQNNTVNDVQTNNHATDDKAQANNHAADNETQANNHTADDEAQANNNHAADDKAQANNHVADDEAQANNHAADDKAQTDDNTSNDGGQTNKENDAPLEQGANHNVADDGASSSRGDGKFFEGANLQGTVVEFSETGFTLSPASMGADGKVLAEAAPKSESDENNVQITYTDNTVFQIVTYSRDSWSELSRKDTDKESVKKRTSVAIFGSCQDTYHWTADKILIIRFQ